VLLLLGALSSLSVLISQLPLPVQLALCVLVISGVLVQYRAINRSFRLSHVCGEDNSNNQWIVQRQGSTVIEGPLVSNGYRSAYLLVMVIASSENKARFRIPVWSDSVSAKQFSYLNAQILFNRKTAI
jgi:hypothetical protein